MHVLVLSIQIRRLPAALAVASESDAHRFFDALKDGGKIDMPLGPTFWSPCYGMVTDKFNVGWMVMVASESP